MWNDKEIAGIVHNRIGVEGRESAFEIRPEIVIDRKVAFNELVRFLVFSGEENVQSRCISTEDARVMKIKAVADYVERADHAPIPGI